MKDFEMPPNGIENSTEKQKKESKEIYINKVLMESKNRLSEYFPLLYKNIPTHLNYQDNAEELKINYHFEGENLNINIQTPENLSEKTVDDLNKTKRPYVRYSMKTTTKSLLCY